MSNPPVDSYWLGPTYEFHAGPWLLTAGIPVEEGRLEWMLSHLPDGVADSSRSFVLDPHATRDDLEAALADLAPDVVRELVERVMEQSEPSLLSREGGDEGLA
ncbi:MAG TPA: hypothetical protein VNF07_02960 [Acidimicrobiales bacterium]|nr:hypothetical protein [Acidimicrobiales bacterium]